VRGLWQGALAFIAAALFVIGAGLIAAAVIAGPLPHWEELDTRASAFQSMRILDREGNLLTESFDPNAGRRTVVPIDEISPYLLQATVATEDANFYDHQGVDPVALMRALYYAVIERDFVSGASTIPQQLVKMLFLTPEQTLTRKIKEAILSAEVSRQYPKEKILELYLNELYYGNLAYGIDAAAHTYFNKDAKELTLAEASLLAGLPQLPAAYDPYTNSEAAYKRQAVVLALMVENGYITPEEADAAYLEKPQLAPLSFDMKYPHFTLFVRQQLEAIANRSDTDSFEIDDIYQLGLEVNTTLDPDLQDAAERIVAEQVARLADRNVSNGALVAVRPATGEIVAFVGSADFDNVEIDGQVNMALAPRQPGSSIKPFVYLAAFEQPEKPVNERWTPGTLIADIKQEFPDGANPPYIPTNYDLREHGMVTARTALANSYNIPAVRTLQTVELPDFLELTRRLGITTLTRPDYGLSLALGGGEVPLIEMTGAFAVLANGGKRVPPVAILKVTTNAGEVICEQGSSTALPCQSATVVSDQQVVSAADAFLITDILSDNAARALAFGPNSVLQLDRPAAVKTGTTNDFRDNLTMGYTPQLVTGVWIGNANNSEMRDISGVSGAGPIWSQFMTYAHRDVPVEQFIPPAGVRQFEVCADTGTMPSQACPERRQQWFAEDRPPLPADRDLYQIVRFDRNSGQLATEFTPGDAIEEKVFKVYPPEYRQWAEEHGIPQPPASPDDVYEFTPELHIRQPVEGEVVSGIVPVVGSANAPGFRGYEVQYGVSHDPGAFSPPFAGSGAPVLDSLLGEWDTRNLDEGPHTIRLLVYGENNAIFEQRIRVFVAAATPTPEPTMTWTPPPPTLTFTPIPEQPTAAPLPTDTPWPTDTVVAPPTDTPWPTDTPLPTDTVAAPPDTPIPTDTPAEIPTETPTVLVEPTITETLTLTPTVEISEAPTEAPANEPTPTWTPQG
jgi:1A family penicillin-binding protein